MPRPLDANAALPADSALRIETSFDFSMDLPVRMQARNATLRIWPRAD
ncbi:MAG: hypothetical protein OXT74_14970 [Candidatus Poribacteria bacterium]|nr:hypothetical protein [Candidatus Poribacteria bacterium]